MDHKYSSFVLIVILFIFVVAVLSFAEIESEDLAFLNGIFVNEDGDNMTGQLRNTDIMNASAFCFISGGCVDDTLNGSNYLLLDGTREMEGNIDMNDNDINNTQCLNFNDGTDNCGTVFSTSKNDYTINIDGNHYLNLGVFNIFNITDTKDDLTLKICEYSTSCQVGIGVTDLTHRFNMFTNEKNVLQIYNTMNELFIIEQAGSVGKVGINKIPTKNLDVNGDMLIDGFGNISKSLNVSVNHQVGGCIQYNCSQPSGCIILGTCLSYR